MTSLKVGPRVQDISVYEQLGTAGSIELAALEAFYEKGYHGASIRDIAARAGIGLATLFHHFGSKSAILDRVMNRAVDQLHDELESQLRNVESPRERLRTAMRILVLAHCVRQMQSFVAQSEFRSLGPEQKEIVRRKRVLVYGIFFEAVTSGVATGDFECDQPSEAAQAIVSMGTMVASWFRTGGPRTPAQVAATYADLALRMLAPAATQEGRDNARVAI